MNFVVNGCKIKLQIGKKVALRTVKSSLVTIGRWSVQSGHIPGFMLQVMMGFILMVVSVSCHEH